MLEVNNRKRGREREKKGVKKREGDTEREREIKNEWKRRSKNKEGNDTGLFDRKVIFKLLIFYQCFSETRYVFSRIIWDIVISECSL